MYYMDYDHSDEAWTEHLSEDVCTRLCQCETTRADLPELVEARWEYGTEATKEDALDYVLEILDANGLYEITDLSQGQVDLILGAYWMW